MLKYIMNVIKIEVFVLANLSLFQISAIKFLPENQNM